MAEPVNERPEAGDLEPSAADGKDSRVWLAILEDAEKAFDIYQRKSDEIDRLFADLDRLADVARDRKFNLFWSNVQVMTASIYSRPPVPVVAPRFKDRIPLDGVTSEFLERACSTAMELADVDAMMQAVRDDLAIVARGVAWVRYETAEDSDTESERVCVEHIDRRDFRHEPATAWCHVGWVARRAWLTRLEMKERFAETSGDAWMRAGYQVPQKERDVGATDSRAKAPVWEIWSKSENKVVWVTPGVDEVLDQDDPHLKLEGFFPCPEPAYATKIRGSLVPAPDVLFYKDQLEEINDLTARIHALSQALRVRGFYPAGAGAEIGDAIQQALASTDDRQIMVPISNWAAFGNGGAKDTVVWLPLDMIASTITQLVALRDQIITDVYQIMGLSDIMRGATEASETLGAQELKAQFGSVRLRGKIAELVRIARDTVRIAAEIMAEKFAQKTLLEMTRMKIPTDAEIKAQVKAIEAMAKQQLAAMVEQAGQQAQPGPNGEPPQAPDLQALSRQVAAQALPQIKKLEQTPTIEQVMKLLRDERLRPFVLDIETDSTIQPDEQAEKQGRAEFLTALAQAMQQMAPMLAAAPESAPFAGQVLKFALAPYRAGRDLDAAIDEFVDGMIQRAQNPRPNPEAEAAKAEQAIRAQELQMEQQRFQLEMQTSQADLQVRVQEAQAAALEAQTRAETDRAKIAAEVESARGENVKLSAEVQKLLAQVDQIRVQTQSEQVKTGLAVEQAQVNKLQAAHGMASDDRAAEMQAQQAQQERLNGGPQP